MEINTILEANTASHLYLSAKIAVVVPAGIPVKTVDIPISKGSALNFFNMAKTVSGNKTKRIKAKYKVEVSNICFILQCDNILPITSIETGIVHLLISTTALFTIDLAAAKKYGIPVKNVPNQSTESVAELAVSFLLSLSRKLKMANKGLESNKYDTFAPLELVGTEVYGKTLALVGMGNIAMRIAEIMKSAFKVRIIGYDPYITIEKAQQMGVEKFFSLQELFREADLINVSVPLVDATRNLVNEEVLSVAKKSLILVNTSRGGVVDEQALYKALVHGKIGAAASDVFLSEPPSADNPLVSLDNFIATPHIGGSTKESLERVGNEAVDNLFNVLDNFGIR